MKRVNSDKKASIQWSAARNKERPSSFRYTTDKLIVNCRSNGYRVSLFGLHGISLVRASEETFRTDALEALENKGNGCLLGELNHRRPVLPGPASPRCPAVRRPVPLRPALGMSAFLDRQVILSPGSSYPK